MTVNPDRTPKPGLGPDCSPHDHRGRIGLSCGSFWVRVAAQEHSTQGQNQSERAAYQRQHQGQLGCSSNSHETLVPALCESDLEAFLWKGLFNLCVHICP